MNRHTRTERGFGTIEVLIAVLMLMVVASAISLATTTSGQLRGSVRLQASMTTASQRVLEDVVTDRSWMKRDACKRVDVPCTIPSSIVSASSLELRDVEGEAVLHELTATALDSEIDGRGEDDEDGLIPDYYRLLIEIRPSADVARRYRTTPARAARRVVTTIDRRGEEARGSLSLEVCEVHNQTDERMSIQGCARNTTSSIKMAGCPVPGSACTGVFGQVSSRSASKTNASPFVVMDRVPPRSLGVRIRHVASGWIGTAADAEVDPAGRLTFQNVPAGEVVIERLPATIGGTTERWKTKELPSYLGAVGDPGAPVIVEPGVQARALALYRPAMTNRGINLTFERRTHTHHVTGPHQGYNLVVPKWRPTDSYEGEWAERICEVYDMDFSGFGGVVLDKSCDGVRPGPGKNCASVYISGQYFAESASGNYARGDHGMYKIDWEFYEENDLEFTGGQRFTIKYASNVRIAKLCTEYWEEYFTTYYKRSSTSNRIRDGIAQPLTYSIEPAPDNRYVEKRGTETRTVVSQCVAARKQNCRTSGDAPYGLNRLVPGLNTGLRPSRGSAAGSSSSMSVAAANRVNTELGVTPSSAWDVLNSAALWVRPNGDVVGSNGGTVRAGTTITARGEGECYWIGGPNLRSEAEGSCNPCTVLWQSGWEFPNACSVLTKILWKRHARELRHYYDFPSGASDGFEPREGDLESKQGEIPVLQACRDEEPRVIGRCRTVERRSDPPPVPKTRHSSDAGTGVVNSRPVNSAPGET